jgi:hypothetical protein
MISGSGFPPFFLAWPIITAALPGAAWYVPAVRSGAAVVLLSARAVLGLVRFEPGQAFAWHHYYSRLNSSQPFF